MISHQNFFQIVALKNFRLQKGPYRQEKAFNKHKLFSKYPSRLGSTRRKIQNCNSKISKKISIGKTEKTSGLQSHNIIDE